MPDSRPGHLRAGPRLVSQRPDPGRDDPEPSRPVPQEPLGPVEIPEPEVVDLPEPGVVEVPERRV